MGCHGPKSVISVRNELSFLDLTVQQLEVSSFKHLQTTIKHLQTTIKHLQTTIYYS
jgi:UDP-glucose pyrophosphorylase